VLCEAQCIIDPTEYIRVLERRMHQTGWVHIKVTLRTSFSEKDAQNSKYRIKVLCLHGTSKLPTKSDYASLSALIMGFPRRKEIMPSISFLKV
jgi:hypothetical protein